MPAESNSVDISSLFASFNLGYWLLQTLAMLLTCFLIKGLKVTNPLGALLTVIAIAVVNAHLWSAALFFSVPQAFTTQAATLVVANGVLFWVLVKLLPGIEISGIFPALFAPLVFSGISMIIDKYDDQIPWSDIYTWASDSLQFLMQKAVEHRDELQPAAKTP